MCAVPTAPAWLERASLGAQVMGTAPSRGGARAAGVYIDDALTRAHAYLKVLDTLEAGEPDRAEVVMRQHIRQIRAKTPGGVA